MKAQSNAQKHAKRVVNTFRTPVDNFLRMETASGILLMATTMLAADALVSIKVLLQYFLVLKIL